MMKILSADMATIPKQAVKKIFNKYFGLQITEDGASALARLLEKKAKKISAYAVKNAKKEKRDKITKKDIEDYVLKVGSDEN
jgi:histone H3/H4